jgi:hypothetical protein
MFGKRETEEVVGRDASSKYLSPATEIILDYVLSHLKGDKRPYLRLDILGISLLGLLDSGASRTVMGGTAWSQFQNLGLPLLSDTIECTVADGRVCRSIGCIQVPVKLLERLRLITIDVVPSLIEGLLLGKDFWKLMEVVPDLSKDVWYFSSDVSRTLQISTFSEKIGLFDQSSLSPAQKVILEDLISEQSRDQPQSFGKVKTVQHHIEVQPNVLPIKQRFFFFNAIPVFCHTAFTVPFRSAVFPFQFLFFAYPLLPSGGATGLRGTFPGHPRPFHLTFTDIHNTYIPMGAFSRRDSNPC